MFHRLAGAALLGFLLVGCTTLVQRPTGNLAAEPAPDFEGTDAQGKSVRAEDLRGKVVLLSFWSGH